MSPGCFKLYGQWVMISESSGKQQVTFTEGVVRSYTVSDTITWGSQVTASVKAGFNLQTVSGEVAVTGQISETLANSYSQAFSMSSTTSFQYAFDAGVVWQWQWVSHEACGSSTFMGKDLVLTNGAYDAPCCVPGWFQNISNPHGDCHPTLEGKIFSFCSGAWIVV